MVTVVLCGKGERELSGAVRRALAAYGATQCYDGAVLQGVSCGEAPAFLLYESVQVPEIISGNGILIFKDSFQSGSAAKTGAFLPILGAQNRAAAAALKNTGQVAITCGASPRDTISIASLGEESAVVSLQRNVQTLSGQLLEPHDFTVKLKRRTGMFALLAACSALLLADLPSGNGYCF